MSSRQCRSSKEAHPQIEFKPWARALAETKAGSYDGIFTLWYRKEREEFFVFSIPFVPNQNLFLKLKDSDFSTRDSGEKLSVGAVIGYSLPSGFKMDDYDMQETIDDQHNIKLLLNQRVDMIMIDKVTGVFHMQKLPSESMERVEWVLPPLESVNQHIGFSKQSADHLQHKQAFDKGLKSLDDSGKLKEILKRYKFEDVVFMLP